MQPATELLIICGTDSLFTLDLSEKLANATGEADNTEKDGSWHLKKTDSQGRLFFASAAVF